MKVKIRKALTELPVLFGCSTCWAEPIAGKDWIEVERDAIKVRRAKEIDGRTTLSCHQAHVVAETLGVELQLVGQICNEAHIKIIDCELGCFGDRSHT